MTTSAWHVPDPFFEVPGGVAPLAHPIDQRAMQLSDIVTIHAYCDAVMLKNIFRRASIMGKPILLTEWMARHVGSTFENLLPVLEEYNVGSYHWGLVQGKTQTNLAWPHVAQNFIGNKLWFHDVFNHDGTPHVESEAAFLKSFTAEVKSRALSGCKRRHKKTFSYVDLAQEVAAAAEKAVAELPVIPPTMANRGRHRKTFSCWDLAQEVAVAADMNAAKVSLLPSAASRHSMNSSAFAGLLMMAAVNTALNHGQTETN